MRLHPLDFVVLRYFVEALNYFVRFALDAWPLPAKTPKSIKAQVPAVKNSVVVCISNDDQLFPAQTRLHSRPTALFFSAINFP